MGSLNDLITDYDRTNMCYEDFLHSRLFKDEVTTRNKLGSDLVLQSLEYGKKHGRGGRIRHAEALRIKALYDQGGIEAIDRLIAAEAGDNRNSRWRLRKRYYQILQEVLMMVTESNTVSRLYSELKAKLFMPS
jgi:hypothetical protein